MSYAMFNVWKGVAEYFISVPKESHFYDQGKLTPEEFVKAGDLITERCATWAWSGGEPSKRKDYLPPDKQFLITRNGEFTCFHHVTTISHSTREETDLTNKIIFISLCVSCM